MHFDSLSSLTILIYFQSSNSNITPLHPNKNTHTKRESSPHTQYTPPSLPFFFISPKRPLFFFLYQIQTESSLFSLFFFTWGFELKKIPCMNWGLEHEADEGHGFKKRACLLIYYSPPLPPSDGVTVGNFIFCRWVS